MEGRPVPKISSCSTVDPTIIVCSIVYYDMVWYDYDVL